MKGLIISTITCCFLILSVSSFIKAQNIPNADFDSIYIGGIDRVYHWVTSDAIYFSNDTVVPFPPGAYYPPQSGNHHFLIKTTQVNYFDTAPGHYLKSVVLYNLPELKYPDGSQFNSFICNGDHFYSDAQGFIDFPKGGSPFTWRPAFICGSYKFFDSLAAVPDFGKVTALLKKWNPLTLTADTIAVAQSGTELSPSAVWKSFSIPFVYADTAMPDSVVVVISSSTLATAPTTLFIDDILFDFTTAIHSAVNARFYRKVYPNPCRDELFFTPSAFGPARFAVYTIQGVRLKEGISGDGKISMAGITAGTYVLMLREGETVSRIRLSKVE
ncbi:MAG: T9SS type A sorting domain-containing protein [Bacteroidales bacterium]